jgi:signal transduction histidine kinase
MVESHDRVYLASPVRNSGGDVTAVVVVTESMGPYETTRIVVLSVLAGLAVLVTGGSAAIAAWTMRRALGPVEEMATLATDWSEHDLEARFDGQAESDEISTLGRTLNVLLDRVAGALRNEQQLTSELAHELRTPLTAIRGEAELGLMAAPDATTRGRFENVVQVVDRMNATVGTLLAVARGHTGRGPAGRVDDVVSSVLTHRPGPSELAWSVDAGVDLLVAAPTDLAARALAPLADNAARYARSSVTISAEAHDRVVEITVSDDGEGVGDGDVEGIFDAGRRHADSDGAGLGLALSRRVARTLGGDVTVTSVSAPTSFTLRLPRF